MLRVHGLLKLLFVVISQEDIARLGFGYCSCSDLSLLVSALSSDGKTGWLRLSLLLDSLELLYISIELYFLLKSPIPLCNLDTMTILILLACANLQCHTLIFLYLLIKCVGWMQLVTYMA